MAKGGTPGSFERFRASLGVVVAAWFLSLGFDFFLHGGALARLYLSESPFLLPAESAFVRIPLGYLSFLVLTGGLWWLCEIVGTDSWIRGLPLGLVVGLVVWGALALGLFSISTAPPSLLAGWWAGQALELGLAGGVIGAGLGGFPRRRLYLRVATAVFVCLLATIVLQSTGLAPPMRIVPR